MPGWKYDGNFHALKSISMETCCLRGVGGGRGGARKRVCAHTYTQKNTHLTAPSRQSSRIEHNTNRYKNKVGNRDHDQKTALKSY